MDSLPPAQTAAPSIEEDEWDSEGFVIPSLGIEEPDQNQVTILKVEDSKPPEIHVGKEEKIYLGPHGAPPSQVKQFAEQNFYGRKQRYKHNSKETDRQYSGLVGGPKMPPNASKWFF